MATRYIRGSVIHNRHDPLDHGLVADWRFDANTGLMVPDHSPIGHQLDHSTAGATGNWGGSQWGMVYGFVGGAATEQFATTDNTYETNLYSGMAELTVETLYYLDSVLTTAAFPVIVNKGGCYEIDGSNAGDNVYGSLTGTGSGTGWFSAAAARDAWHHVVLTYDGETAYLYVDGLLGASNINASGPIVSNANDVVVGRSLGGNIGLVRIYRRYMTANKVMARYQLCRRRRQTFGGKWMMTRGMAAAAAERALRLCPGLVLDHHVSKHYLQL